MADLKILQIYASPWSERALWALDYKKLSYDKEEYQLLAGEPQLREQSKQNTLPVLFAGDRVIPDSTLIMDYIEEQHPDPPLMPASPQERAEVVKWEQLMVSCMGPYGRMLALSKSLAAGVAEMKPMLDHMVAKYNYSPFDAERAQHILKQMLQALATNLSGREYLVGDKFTRADLTVAAMLINIKPPSDELYPLPPPYRASLTASEILAPEHEPIFEWRDRMYRQHRRAS